MIFLILQHFSRLAPLNLTCRVPFHAHILFGSKPKRHPQFSFVRLTMRLELTLEPRITRLVMDVTHTHMYICSSAGRHQLYPRGLFHDPDNLADPIHLLSRYQVSFSGKIASRQGKEVHGIKGKSTEFKQNQ